MNRSFDEEKKFKEETLKIIDTIKNPKNEEERQPIHIFVGGPSQAGKSTLINQLFGANFQVTHTGKPCTMKMKSHITKDGKMKVFDSRGLERGSGVNKSIFKKLPKMHMVFIVLNYATSIEEVDFDYLKIQKSDVPCILILNKVDYLRRIKDSKRREQVLDAFETVELKSKKLKKVRERLLGFQEKYPQIKRIIPTSLVEDDEDCDDEDEHTEPPLVYGSTQILTTVIALLAQAQQILFVELLKKNNNTRLKLSTTVVAIAVATVSGAAWIPVPAVDSIDITTAQVGMVMSLFGVWGVSGDNTKSLAGALVKATLPALGSFAVGYTIAQSLKFVPLYGTIFGGALTMGIASSATAIIGATVTAYLKQNASSLESKSLDEIKQEFSQFVMDNKNIKLDYLE